LAGLEKTRAIGIAQIAGEAARNRPFTPRTFAVSVGIETRTEGRQWHNRPPRRREAGETCEENECQLNFETQPETYYASDFLPLRTSTN
jgi:hypothetical protein